jgi:hypothetical protein
MFRILCVIYTLLGFKTVARSEKNPNPPEEVGSI